VTDGEKVGERGTWAARQVECLPLAQAEQRLTEATRALIRAEPNGGGPAGWLRRWLERKLLAHVKRLTLASFREEGAQEGGVDLLKVQARLEATIDEQVIARLRGTSKLWITLVIIGLPLIVAVQTYIFVLLLHAR
jgi:hypothetical protein